MLYSGCRQRAQAMNNFPDTVAYAFGVRCPVCPGEIQESFSDMAR
jgi:hypothetical protein